MAWRTVLTTETDPGAPVTSELMKALADNPAAVAGGETGAPRVTDAALDTTATQAGRDWVGNRLASSALDEVGTLAFLCTKSANVAIAPGQTFSGGDLWYAGVKLQTVGGSGVRPGIFTGAAVSGTWRALGATDGEADYASATLFIKISA